MFGVRHFASVHWVGSQTRLVFDMLTICVLEMASDRVNVVNGDWDVAERVDLDEARIPLMKKRDLFLKSMCKG